MTQQEFDTIVSENQGTGLTHFVKSTIFHWNHESKISKYEKS